MPCIFCLVLYWPGLLAWFQQDDFVWLNLPNQAHGWDGLLRTLFQPNAAQGSWRPLSERAFFLVFGVVFGPDPLPYRIWVFLTQFANLALVACITTRLTRSRAAGFWAAILWVANSKLATVMCWSSTYNLVLCGFFLLLALHLFLRYIETASRRYYIWTWVVFLAGFLAMETNVIFPLLAASYTLACARRHFRLTLPFFAASAAYAILHFILWPNHAPAYVLHIDRAMPATLWTYWQGTFEPSDLAYLSRSHRIVSGAAMAASTAALLAFTVYQAARRRWLATVLLAWYVIALAPVLPLRDHVTDYYLTLPAMCLAMLAGYALSWAWQAGTLWKALAVAIVAGFLVQSLPAARRRAEWYRSRSEAQEALVMGVAAAHQLHPGKAILLDGVDDSLFSQCISQRPFLFLRIPDVYLAPGAEDRIAPHPEWGGVSKFVMPVDETSRGLDRDEIVVYRLGKGPLRNITHQYVVPEGPARAEGPLRVDVADQMAADRLGPEWYGLESGIRWMPRIASLRMPAPRTPGQKLYVTAVCPAAQLEKGPLQMTLTVDGIRLPSVKFTQANVETTFAFDLPPGMEVNGEINITVEVDRTVRVGADQRDLGLAFGRFEIR